MVAQYSSSDKSSVVLHRHECSGSRNRRAPVHSIVLTAPERWESLNEWCSAAVVTAQREQIFTCEVNHQTFRGLKCGRFTALAEYLNELHKFVPSFWKRGCEGLDSFLFFTCGNDITSFIVNMRSLLNRDIGESFNERPPVMMLALVLAASP